jgi:CubicO group peptidase (beta-lactamase class C family)
MRDWGHMIRVIERTPPIHEPGTHTGYHGLTYGFLVGELIQRVSGRSFSDVVREAIAEPLDLDGLYVGVPAEELPRAASLLWPTRGWLAPGSRTFAQLPHSRIGALPIATVQRGLELVGLRVDLESILDSLAPHGIDAFDFGAAETLQASIPAANGLFTARSLARMYAMLAGDGAIDGVRLLSPETLARATEVQPPADRRVVIPFDMRWRLGYHAVFTTRGVPKRAFGHFGFGGSGAFADPRRRLAVGLVVNSGMGTPFGDMRIMRIGGAALACVNQRRARAAA